MTADGPLEPPGSAPGLSVNERLSIPFQLRAPGTALLGFVTGFGMGLSHGGTMAGMRFRAEHAHMFPSSTAGWYFYHKSKNYHVMLGGLREGSKIGFKIAFWTGSFFVIEEAVDRYWQKRSFLSSVLAGTTMAGAFSAWSE